MLCSDCYRDRILADPALAADGDEDYDGPDMGDGVGFAPGRCAACGRGGIVFDVEREPVEGADPAHCGAAGHHADEARA